MRKRVIQRCLIALLCTMLLASCGSSSSMTERENSDLSENMSASESQQEEKQPYEIVREKENENKQIAEDEELQEMELKAALGKLTFQYTEDEDIGDYLAGLSSFCLENEQYGKSCIAPFVYLLGPSTDPILSIGFNYVGDEYLDVDTLTEILPLA